MVVHDLTLPADVSLRFDLRKHFETSIPVVFSPLSYLAPPDLELAPPPSPLSLKEPGRSREAKRVPVSAADVPPPKATLDHGVANMCRLVEGLLRHGGESSRSPAF